MYTSPMLQTIVTILSLIAAILAWIAKIKWSKEYAAAKDEVIRAKDAQIETKNSEIGSLKTILEQQREMTSTKMREQFLSMKVALEEYVDELKTKLEGALKENDRIVAELGARTSKSAEDAQSIQSLIKERAVLKSKVEDLEASAKRLARTFDPFNGWEQALGGFKNDQRELQEALKVMDDATRIRFDFPELGAMAKSFDVLMQTVPGLNYWPTIPVMFGSNPVSKIIPGQGTVQIMSSPSGSVASFVPNHGVRRTIPSPPSQNLEMYEFNPQTDSWTTKVQR